MYPLAGSVGQIKLKMYRGVKPLQDRVHKDFASDPGDYGCGEYWTNDESSAVFYGDVITKEIVMENVYHIPMDELKKLIEEYRTCKIEDGHEKRRNGSLLITNYFMKKGYKAVLTEGYESFDEVAICIFQESL